MEPNVYLTTIKQGWRWIVAGGVIGALVALVWSLSATPMYRATNTLYFSLQGGDSAQQILEGSTFAQNQVQSFALLAEKPAVLDPVIAQLGLPVGADELAGQVTANVNLETVLLDVTASDADPAQAAQIANATAVSLADVINTLEGGTGKDTPRVKAATVATAHVPTAPSTPRTTVNVLVGLLLGLGVGLAYVLLRGVLDTKVRDEERLRRVTQIPVIGSISDNGALDTARKPGTGRPAEAAHAQESFRRLRSGIEYLNVDRDHRMLAISSATAVDGKSTVAINVARAFAEVSKVLLVDADLRKPTLASKLGLEGSVGLSGVLARHYPMDVAVQHVPRTGLDVLASGEIPPNPAELLASQEMRTLLERIRSQYDWVFIDTPPLLPVSDPTVLGKQVDGLLLVVNAQQTTFQNLRAAIRIIEVTGIHCPGVVLNRTPARHGDDYYRREEDPSATVRLPAATTEPEPTSRARS